MCVKVAQKLPKPPQKNSQKQSKADKAAKGARNVGNSVWSLKWTKKCLKWPKMTKISVSPSRRKARARQRPPCMAAGLSNPADNFWQALVRRAGDNANNNTRFLLPEILLIVQEFVFKTKIGFDYRPLGSWFMTHPFLAHFGIMHFF